MRDNELVRATLLGSEEAFRQLVLRYEKPVFSLIVRMVRDRQLAEDLSQETFLKAHRALASYHPERRFSSWLFKIAHNATIDYLRRQRLPTTALDGAGQDAPSLADVLEDATSPSPESRAEASDLAVAMEAALARLRPEYREVVVLRFAQGLPYHEIAEVTGLAIGTVKTHIHRARKQLMGILEAQGWAPAGSSGRPERGGGQKREKDREADDEEP